jgi:DNA-binding MarR family transcriptional regulator
MHLNYIDKEMGKRGIGVSRFPPILFILHNEMKGKSASQKELADFLGITPASLAISIKRMEKSGLVKKTTDKKDLRRNIITLTATGEQFVQDSMLVFDNVDRKIYEGFTDKDKEQLKAFYIRIIQNLEKLGIQPPVQFSKE